MVIRYHYLLAAVAAILLVVALFHRNGGLDGIEKSRQFIQDAAHWTSVRPSRPSFYDVANKHGTDKVTVHNYWFMYEKYLQPLRGRRVKMLEIGLGCDMGYGPGKSYDTWLDFFPDVDLYFIEVDDKCMERWKLDIDRATVAVGDQANVSFLQQFMADHGSDFDIIVDDGGHIMHQQITSLKTLWDAVKPGGLYFCEDIGTSFSPTYGGEAPGSHEKPTMLNFVYELLEDKMNPDGATRKHTAISDDLRAIDCDKEICAFVKKDPGTV